MNFLIVAIKWLWNLFTYFCQGEMPCTMKCIHLKTMSHSSNIHVSSHKSFTLHCFFLYMQTLSSFNPFTYSIPSKNCPFPKLILKLVFPTSHIMNCNPLQRWKSELFTLERVTPHRSVHHSKGYTGFRLATLGCEFLLHLLKLGEQGLSLNLAKPQLSHIPMK